MYAGVPITTPGIVASARAVRVADLVISAGLLADGLGLVPIKPLWGVLTMAVAVGIALAALLMEPATTDAAFGQDKGR